MSNMNWLEDKSSYEQQITVQKVVSVCWYPAKAKRPLLCT